MSTVFISYSHDSDAHKQRVQALAERLRGALSGGVRVVIDQDRLPGGPDEGWLDWSEQQVRDADQVLVVCSERYRDSYEGRALPGTGLGVGWEAGLIKQTLYDARGVNPKFRVVLFTEEERAFVPLGLARYHAFRLWQGDADLIAWLRGGPAVAPPAEPAPIHWPATLAPVSGILADRKQQFDCFERMLRGQSDQRILLLHGPSGRGKTVLLRHFSDLIEQLNVAHAKIDLKGCPTLDDVLQAVALDLPERLVSSSRRAVATTRATTLLQDLELAREPVVLAFDTYERATDDVRRWIEARLLDRTWRCPALIVVVLGQEAPDRSKHGWADLACTFELPPITEVDDWMAFCARRHARAPLVRQHVEALALAAQGEPAHISQLLESLVRRLA